MPKNLPQKKSATSNLSKTNTHLKIDCLVPYFNERTRIGTVLKYLIQVPQINTIIGVDDGSTDGTSEYIAKNFPQVKIVKLTKNSGKTAALKKGIESVKTQYVLLFDADLKYVNPKNVRHCIQSFLNQKSLPEMVILRRSALSFFGRIFRSNLILGGERIVRTNDLKNVLNKKIENYQVECVLNQYLLDKESRITWVDFEARNRLKFSKWPFPLSLIKFLEVNYDLCIKVGLFVYFYQFFYLCRDPDSKIG